MKIAPSILNANFVDLKNELDSINESDYIHIDVMDGNFVPNISFGPDITKQIAENTKVPLDVHLMVQDPIKWVDEFAHENVKYITVHYEANNFLETIDKIKESNTKVGIAINPYTDLLAIEDLLSKVDLVLIMSVQPGFGGQKFMPEVLKKVRRLKQLKTKNNYNYVIEIDGGINKETIELARAAGVDIAVVGSYLLKQKDRNKTIRRLR